MLSIETLKNLLGIAVNDVSKDIILHFILDDVQEIILNYCHIDAIPKGLNNTAYRMAMDIYRAENFGDEDNSAGDVTSIKEGDTTVNFGNINSANITVYTQSLLKIYATQLRRYRRLAK